MINMMNMVDMMNMKSGDILGLAIRAKLAVVKRVTELLPEEIKPIVKEAEKAFFTAIRDQISLYLEKDDEAEKDAGSKSGIKTGIRKVEVE